MSFWSFKRRGKPPEKDAHTLGDIARGMQHAVNTTQELLERHYAQMLSRYFNEDGTPVTRQFTLPDGSKVDVPVIALVPASSLVLQEMTVRMSVRVDETKVKPADVEDASDHLTRTSFQVSFAGGPPGREQNCIDITMRFVTGDPPEGVARVMEQYANAVLARKTAPPR
jgi:Protein of unknown function (DUF2589)